MTDDMMLKRTGLLIFLVSALFLYACHTENDSTPGGILHPQPFNEVVLHDSFWLPRLKIQADVLVPFALDKTEPAVENLRRTGSFLKGIPDELPFPHRFVSSDLYKVMEGVAYILMIEDDPALERKMDSIIDIIADAQQEDGYLYVAHTTGVSRGLSHSMMGDRPYSYVLHSHELYNVGHMYEAAVAYFQATGKRKWLDVAEKNAQHVNRVFFEGDPDYNDGKPVNQAPGHQEIELGLIKLYRATGKRLYLDMSKKFLDIRGVTYQPEGDAEGVMTNEYAQQHLPVRDQREAVGHAVRAGYLYAAMAENAALHQDTTFDEALESIWHDIVDTKMHIIGGLGAVAGIEGFGPAYVLPNKGAYAETCAAVANVLFNYRMFLMTGDARYMDVAEVSLFNNALAGVNLDGNRFFYSNKLEVDWTRSVNRSPWFGTACCPSNIARLMPQVSGYMYTYNSDEIYTCLYASSTTVIPFRNGAVKLVQQANYPFSGEIKLTVESLESPQSPQSPKFTIKLRIPAWARSDHFVPGALYPGLSDLNQEWEVRVNGRRVRASLDKGFAVIERRWKPGDEITLSLPMPVRFIETVEQVEENTGRVAVTRGPLVYCAEGIDHQAPVQAMLLRDIPAEDHIQLLEMEGRMQGIIQLRMPALRYTEEGFVADELTLVPYYAWNNREAEDGSMLVWMPREESLIDPDRALGMRTPQGISAVSASHTYRSDHAYALIDRVEPKSSSDHSILRWTNYNRPGQTDYVELTLEPGKKLVSVAPYFYDDQGGVQLPQAWHLEGLDQPEGWWQKLKIYNTDSYSVLPDQYNLVHLARPQEYIGIRICVTGKPDASVGLLEVQMVFEQ